MNFITAFAAAILGHFVGDYIFQNQWMAIGKSQPGWKGTLACTVHVLLYTLAVALFIGWNPLFLLVVAVPHWIIDRWSLATYILQFKNGYHPFKETWQQTPKSLDPAVEEEKLILNVWKVAFAAPVYIFNDNTLHWVCLWFTCKYFFHS
jgi:Protein of unknown function (DUF3307)